MTVKTSNAVTATTVYVTIMTYDFAGLQQQLRMQKCNKHMKI
jgi:GH18 family chitinase